MAITRGNIFLFPADRIGVEFYANTAGMSAVLYEFGRPAFRPADPVVSQLGAAIGKRLAHVFGRGGAE